MVTTRAPLENPSHSLLDWRDLFLQLFATYFPIARLMPECEYFFYFFQQRFAHKCRLAASINHRLKVSLQVCPAYLPPSCCQPVVCSEPIRSNNAFGLLAYDLFSPPGRSPF
jgi:hypothetical protein